jgi:hypothetical protein
MTMTTAKLSNKCARQYFLHDSDTHYDEVTGETSPCCFFAEGKGGWGFWVRADGTVDVDSESSNGQLPTRGIVNACRRAAVLHLRK